MRRSNFIEIVLPIFYLSKMTSHLGACQLWDYHSRGRVPTSTKPHGRADSWLPNSLEALLPGLCVAQQFRQRDKLGTTRRRVLSPSAFEASNLADR